MLAELERSTYVGAIKNITWPQEVPLWEKGGTYIKYGSIFLSTHINESWYTYNMLGLLTPLH